MRTKLIVALTVFTLSGASTTYADDLNIQADPNIEISISGQPEGGAAEELVGYLAKGGLSPQTTQGAISYYDQSVIWGWESSIPSKSYTFFFAFQPGEEKRLSLNSTTASNGYAGPNRVGPAITIIMPDKASALLYSLMSKAGVQANETKDLTGKNIICYGHHGYPAGPLDPSCWIFLAR